MNKVKTLPSYHQVVAESPASGTSAFRSTTFITLLTIAWFRQSPRDGRLCGELTKSKFLFQGSSKKIKFSGAMKTSKR